MLFLTFFLVLKYSVKNHFIAAHCGMFSFGMSILEIRVGIVHYMICAAQIVLETKQVCIQKLITLT